MRAPVDQAKLFLKRAIAFEKRATRDRNATVKLKLTLLQLADHYRLLSEQATKINKIESSPRKTA
jgi:hypothetical protein